MLNNLDCNGVTVAICCFNGSARIEATLRHLAQQRDIRFDWEVLLVDNGSTDNTIELAVLFWRKLEISVPLRIVSELRRGTMFARAAAIHESRYRYILYCDDDNWLNADYVSLGLQSIRQSDTIAAVGGMGEMTFEEGFSPPHWIKDYVKGFGTGEQGKLDGDTTLDKGCLYTAGAILDRVWLDKLFQKGFKSLLTGRDGKSLVAGEDTELTYALNLIGGKLYFLSSMRFKHFMPAGRLSWTYLKRLWRAFGYSDLLLYPYKVKLQRKKERSLALIFASTSYSLGKLLLLTRFSRDKEGDPKILHVERKIGALSALLGASSTIRKNKQMADTLTMR